MTNKLNVNAVLNIQGEFTPLDVMNILAKLDKATVEVGGIKATLTLTKAG